MIVEQNNKRYIVFGMSLYEYTNLSHRKNDALCIDIRSGEYEWLNLSDIVIVDGRLPSGMSVHRRKTERKDVNESYVCFECDDIFQYGNDFWEDVEDHRYEALKILYTYINKIKALHGLPTDNLKFLEKYKTESEKESEEERRKRELNEELDEYLRIGEELSKAKNSEEK